MEAVEFFSPSASPTKLLPCLVRPRRLKARPPLTPHKAPREPRASSRGHAHPRSTQGTATGGWKHAAPLFTPCNPARSPTLPTGSHTPAPTGRKSTAQGKAQRRPGIPRPHKTSPVGATALNRPRDPLPRGSPIPSQRPARLKDTAPAPERLRPADPSADTPWPAFARVCGGATPCI